MFRQRLGKTVATLDACADIFDAVTHGLILSLIGKPLKRRDHREACVNHRRKLARENDKIVQRHAATGGASFFGDFFLDGNNEQVAIEQRADGGLLCGSVHGTPDFPASPGFSRNVGK